MRTGRGFKSAQLVPVRGLIIWEGKKAKEIHITKIY